LGFPPGCRRIAFGPNLHEQSGFTAFDHPQLRSNRPWRVVGLCSAQSFKSRMTVYLTTISENRLLTRRSVRRLNLPQGAHGFCCLVAGKDGLQCALCSGESGISGESCTSAIALEATVYGPTNVVTLAAGSAATKALPPTVNLGISTRSRLADVTHGATVFAVKPFRAKSSVTAEAL
jgi:hypothetical protein